MHPTQHSTHTRRAPQASVFHDHGVEITRDDVIDAITQIAVKQSTQYVSIALLAVTLGLIEEDIPWMQQALHELDEQHRVLLSCVEYPQKLPSFIAPWFVRNASGIPCHEICVAPDSHRIKPLLEQHAPELPFYPRAREVITSNPVLRSRRMTLLVEDAANTLFGIGHKPHTLLRVLHVAQQSQLSASTSTKEAA
ncbi:hypothetical protein [Prosthecobacter sp.]|jgi:hypothetical protein|uniref:hypothetical protein n=1 Tax=Prosthecobacter sp. TaxID=1965333 RepID=UPI0037CBCB3C